MTKLVYLGKFKMAAAAILNISDARQLGIEHPFQNENIGPKLHISSGICRSPQNGC